MRSAAVIVALALGAGHAIADDWKVSGTNTLRAEQYDVLGDRTASPYQFEGPQAFDQFSLNLSRRVSEFNVWRAQIYGVLNASAYRQVDRGPVPERLYLIQENGETRTPYRLEVGDYFAYYSFRTLQRSLKGVQLEFQPHPSRDGGPQQSFVFTTGANSPLWRRFELDEDYTHAASYLYRDAERRASYAASAVFNERAANGALLNRVQGVYSLAGERVFDIAHQELTVEGEAAQFDGDHDGLLGPGTGEDRDDQGLFMQFTGRSKQKPLTYRLRYEGYGQDFRPQNGSIQSDRRSIEAHTGYTFAGGLDLRGRYQNFRDGWESINPTDSDTYGLSLSGAFFRNWVSGLTGSLNAFVQDIANRDLTNDVRVTNTTLDLAKPLPDRWTGRFGYFFQETENQVVATAATAITRQFTLGATRPVALWGWQALLSPSYVVRDIDGLFGSNDRQAILAANATRGARLVGMNLSHLRQDRSEIARASLETFSMRTNYQWTAGIDTYNVEYALDTRDPATGDSTDSHMLAVAWTRALGDWPLMGKPRRAPPPPPPVDDDQPLPPPDLTPLAPRRTPITLGAMELGPTLLAQIYPAMDLKTAQERLAQVRLTAPAPLGDYLVYSGVRVLEEVDQKQRFVVQRAGGAVVKTALIVDLADVGDRSTLAFAFERVRKAFLEAFGAPYANVEEGTFEKDVARQLEGGEFVRVTEWSRPEGKIRLGIPRRLDGRVRIEVQFAEKFPPPNVVLWSMDAVP